MEVSNYERGAGVDRRDRRSRLFIINIAPRPASRPRCTRRGIVYTDPTYKTWLETFAALIQDDWHRAPLQRIEHISILINGPSRRGDIDNHIKSVLDGLVRAGVLRNDNLKVLDSIHANFSDSKHTDPCIMVQIFD